jgi:hypothetical protein
VNCSKGPGRAEKHCPLLHTPFWVHLPYLIDDDDDDDEEDDEDDEGDEGDEGDDDEGTRQRESDKEMSTRMRIKEDQ